MVWIDRICRSRSFYSSGDAASGQSQNQKKSMRGTNHARDNRLGSGAFSQHQGTKTDKKFQSYSTKKEKKIESQFDI
jgi:hypothetical protein